MRAAKICLDNRLLKDCINRCYYVAFYAVKAVLAIEGVDFKRHKDAIAYFNKTYVASGKFSREIGKLLGRLKTIREDSDYSEFFLVSIEDTKKQYDAARTIQDAVKKYLGKI
nr:HEPN domain-containing protein [uncultured Blautia sp.]